MFVLSRVATLRLRDKISSVGYLCELARDTFVIPSFLCMFVWSMAIFKSHNFISLIFYPAKSDHLIIMSLPKNYSADPIAVAAFKSLESESELDSESIQRVMKVYPKCNQKWVSASWFFPYLKSNKSLHELTETPSHINPAWKIVNENHMKLDSQQDRNRAERSRLERMNADLEKSNADLESNYMKFAAEFAIPYSLGAEWARSNILSN